ncbi:MAG: NPCBM/NEW2 domain-containing protein [Candidatus Omnitrophota bacterium]
MKKNTRILSLMMLIFFTFLLAVTTGSYSVAAEESVAKKAPVYLSDLKPTSDSSPCITNKDAEGNPLQVPGVKFDKGLCVNTNSELVYTIDGKYSELQVTIGHSSAYQEFKGKLIFTILGDGKVLFESKPMGSKENKEIKVNVKEVHKLVLRVNSDGVNSQFVIWGEALLY